VYGSAHTIFGFILAEAICAIGSTFKCGAFQAWLVDSLKHENFVGDLTKIFARENLFCQIGGGFGAIVGSYLYTYNSTWPWFFGSAGLFAVTVIAQMIMREDYFKRSSISWRRGLISMKETAMTSIHYGINDKAVRFILIITFMQVFVMQALNMYWQPFFKNHHVYESNLGFIYATIMVSVAIGSFIVTRINSVGKERKLILITQIITGVFIIIAAIIPGLFAIFISFFCTK